MNMKLWKINEGATEHLRSKGYWVGAGDIDGLIGIQVGDYSNDKEYPHIGLSMINTVHDLVGVSLDWLTEFEG